MRMIIYPCTSPSGSGSPYCTTKPSDRVITCIGVEESREGEVLVELDMAVNGW